MCLKVLARSFDGFTLGASGVVAACFRDPLCVFLGVFTACFRESPQCVFRGTPQHVSADPRSVFWGY